MYPIAYFCERIQDKHVTNHLVMSIVFVLLLTVPSILSDNSFSELRTKKNVNRHEQTPTTGCGSCKMREDVKAKSLQLIKEKILRKIGKKSALNMTGRVLPQIPQHELDLLGVGLSDMQSDQPEFKPGVTITEEEDDDQGKTEKIFIFSQKRPRMRHSREDHDILYFSLTSGDKKYDVAKAFISIYLEGHDRHPLPEIRVELFKFLKLPNHPETTQMKKVVSKKIKQPFGSGSWMALDFTETVLEWFKKPMENHGFVVRAEVDGKQIVITDPDGPDKGKIPYLVIIPQQPKSRTRRSFRLDCNEQSNQSLCCRYPLTVKFEDIGMHFILAPKSYEAFYCIGECPYMTYQKHPHTHLATLSLNNNLQPCCGPRKLTNITIIYLDQDAQVVVENLSEMAVDRCGCS